MAVIRSINPADGTVVGETPVSTVNEVKATVAAAHRAFTGWRETPIPMRVDYVRKFRTILAEHKEELAQLTTKEVGKPIAEAREDVDFELGFIDYYIKEAGPILGETVIREDKTHIYKTVYEPWGVCASIAPWNFPVSMASSGITAQLLAGNTVIFKPSEYTTMTQKRFVDLFNEAGLPTGVLQCVVGDGEVGKMLVDSDIDLVWFTGSTAVGQEIYKKCAEKFITCVLELGGSSPAVVFADCDFEKTVDTVYAARFYNSGQVCSAVKRLFVEKPVYGKFIKALAAKAEKVKLGDPIQEGTVGPLVSEEQLRTLEEQVEDALAKGARVEAGGKRPEDPELINGFYYPPTVLSHVSKDMHVYTREVFGPVLPAMPFSSEDEAVELANDTPYGLTAEVFTNDKAKAARVAARLEAGGVSINSDVVYSPHCPIGGYKLSGIGREYGAEGFKELAQLKYLCIAK